MRSVTLEYIVFIILYYCMKEAQVTRHSWPQTS